MPPRRDFLVSAFGLDGLRGFEAATGLGVGTDDAELDVAVGVPLVEVAFADDTGRAMLVFRGRYA